MPRGKKATATAASDAAPKPRNKAVDRTKFIKAVVLGHKAGKNPQQIADELGMPLGSFNTRATNYRSQGVGLPKFKSGGSKAKLDIDALNAEIASLSGQDVSEVKAEGAANLKAVQERAAAKESANQSS